MKKFGLFILITVSMYGWEINTHRAIERKAIEKSKNLQAFVKNSGIENVDYVKEKFEGYHKDYRGDYTYTDYVTNGETNGISNKFWKQIFSNARYKSLIEAGSILEDAQWQHFLDGGQYNYYDMAHGRFVNHFYDAQNGGHALTYGAFLRTNALHWGLGSRIFAGNFGGQATYVNSPNIYTYNDTLDYFLKGFTESSPTDRKIYQSKMLVGVGHLLHLMNDMTSPAHTRDDSHPLGDAMEICGRGGDKGNEHKGYRIEGNTLRNYVGVNDYYLPNIPKYSKFSDFISKESYWVSTHFFSNDTIFTKPKPAVSDTYQEFVSDDGVVEKYYIRSDGTTGIPGRTKLGIRIKSYIISELRGKYYTGDASNIVLDKSTFFKGDQTVLEENARILIPRAIANARNFLNYFFRGQISATMTDDKIVVRNRSNPSLLSSNDTASLKTGGKYKLMYEDSSGKRHKLFVRYDTKKLDNSIAYVGSMENPPLVDNFVSNVSIQAGKTITLPIILDHDTQVLIRKNKVIIVYDGIIGKEKSVATCYASKPSGYIGFIN